MLALFAEIRCSGMWDTSQTPPNPRSRKFAIALKYKHLSHACHAYQIFHIFCVGGVRCWCRSSVWIGLGYNIDYDGRVMYENTERVAAWWHDPSLGVGPVRWVLGRKFGMVRGLSPLSPRASCWVNFQSKVCEVETGVWYARCKSDCRQSAAMQQKDHVACASACGNSLPFGLLSKRFAAQG